MGFSNIASRNAIITENINWEMTVLEKSRLKFIINGRPLFLLLNNGHEKTGH